MQAKRRVGLAAAMALTVAGGAASSAEAAAHVPANGRSYFGVSDTGEAAAFDEFSTHIDDHPAVLQTFHIWGTHPWRAMGRWAQTQTRGMLSISTTDDYSGAEIISPRQIARGRGDSYPLTLNRRFAAEGETVYIRLLPEMNGHWNPYCAFNTDGSFRGNSHSTHWFKQAWRRFTLIVRGGERSVINHELMRLGLPKIERARTAGDYRQLDVPQRLPRARVAMQWVPQSSGSPDLRSNGPEDYWPGRRYVDWIGIDIYAKYPNFKGLNRVYGDFRGKPFLIGEWSPWDYDSPAFVKRLFGWARRHARARLLVYYQAFGAANPHHIENYPGAMSELEHELNGLEYDPFAPGSIRPVPPPPDGGVPTPMSFAAPAPHPGASAVDTDLIAEGDGRGR